MLVTVQRTLPNIVRGDTVLMVSIDEDDEPTREAATLFPSEAPIVVDVRPREDALGEKYNRVLDRWAEIYLPMVDYCPQITHGFDRKIVEAANRFPDGIGVVYGHMANFSFPNTQAVTRNLVNMMGYLYPPYFPYWFVDHWVDDIAKLIDRISFADVQIDVMRKDHGTQERRDLQFWTTFYDAGRIVRRRMAREIVESPKFLDAQWRKDITLAAHPLIEFRSQWINDSVRSDAANIGESEGDGGERYQRIKAKALALLAEWAPDMEAELQAVAA